MKGSALPVDGRQVQVHGGATTRLNGERYFRATPPLVTLILSPDRVRLESRFRWLSWLSSDIALRHAEHADPRRRQYLFEARWYEVSSVWLDDRRLGLVSPGLGRCQFLTSTDKDHVDVAAFLGREGIPFEQRLSTREYLRTLRKNDGVVSVNGDHDLAEAAPDGRRSFISDDRDDELIPLRGGSSLEVSPRAIVWTPGTRWPARGARLSIPVGDGTGEASTVTRVRASDRSRFAREFLERCVVTDVQGDHLGSFAVGGEGERSGGTTRPASVDAVRRAVESAGLTWRERDLRNDRGALEAEFPDVASEVRQDVRAARVPRVRHLATASGFLVVAVLMATLTEAPVRFLLPVVAIAFGLNELRSWFNSQLS